MSEVQKLLTESRKKLLDLTLRNSLLNYNLKRKNRIIIVDELPNILYKHLLNGKKLKIDSVPYPEIEEEAESSDIDETSGFINAKTHAKNLGISIDIEAPEIEESSSNIENRHIDNAIQTLHYPDTLEGMLRKRRTDANTAIQETGSNLLYLAIGFLKWKQSVNSEKELYSPLLLIPIQIERGSPNRETGVYSYKIEYTGEDLFSNISLQYKIKNEFGIEIPAFDEDYTPEDYFNKINSICENRPELIGVSRIFALDFFHFSKLLMYLDLDASNWPENRRIEDNKILGELSGNIVNDSSELSLEEVPSQETEKMGLVMDADGSQRDAIAQVLKGHNLIIEGPPGTGKSQTIANLIAVALSEGKSVLFVAEKLVALEVVKKRLDSVGLGHFILELHSHKSNKSNFYTSLKDRVELEVSIPPERLKQNINELEIIKSNVSNYLEVLHTPQKVIEKSAYVIFGEVQNRVKEKFLELSPSEELLKLDNETFEKVSIELSALENYIKEDSNILQSPWNGLITNNAVSLDSGKIIELFKEYQKCLKDLANAFTDEQIRILPKNKDILETLNKLEDKRLLTDFPSHGELNVISSLTLDQLEKLFEDIETCIKEYKSFKGLDFETIDNINEIKELSKELRGFKDIGFFGKIFNGEYKSLRRKFNQIYIQTHKNDPQIMIEILDENKSSLEDYIQNIKNLMNDGVNSLLNNLKVEALNADLLKNLPKIYDDLEELLKFKETYIWRKELLDVGFENEMIEPFLSEKASEYSVSLRRLITNTKPFINKLNNIKNEINHFGFIKENIFFLNQKEFDKQDKILENKLKHSAELEMWIDVSRLLNTLEKYHFSSIIEYARKMKIENDIKNLSLYAYYREWAYYVLRSNDLLSKFNSKIYETYLKRFRDIDSKIGSLYAKEHALHLSKNKAAEGKGGRVKDKTEMQLIRNEINKQMRHIPIRQTIKKAPNAIRSLKPCFMMSPLSVSQFIDPSQEPFDLMIMDEASQIFPEDSLGAIARAKQVVIVGDPNQLPPSSFFSTSKTDEDEEETIATTAESILDLTLRVYPNVKRLKWHYRSQHESLISFSNHHFYDRELMIFPSPSKDATEVGINRKYISNGFFKNQQNINEAVSISNSIVEFLQTNSKESLGVVTMSKKQAELVDRLLEEKTKEDLNIRRLVDSGIKEGKLFIKNLENVQGDEADVLFIGTTYGPDPESKKVYQRFGPINGDHGWRRINVLITRAKKRIVVFTSMVSNDIGHSEGNRGRMALKNYLQYIESGHVESVQGTTTGKEPDSPFEESVIRYIQSLGFIAQPQVGVAGFYIDIGIMVEGSYNYILGIECDGAGYHSSKSARDRDRIRQEILEGMGWEIYRIWSTDWFKHRKNEEERLKKKLIAIKHRAILIDNEETIEVQVNESIDIQVEKIIEIEDTKIKESSTSSCEKVKEVLYAFRKENIEKKYKIDSSSILSDRMIDLLSRTQPITIDEFRLEIPLYLREKIDRNQMEFVDKIFETIEVNS
ncbi:DUF4011 domain-containing protein [Poseidonibacter lekithochrous]|uniref:DUF4011 domain-containing protein n=1 Tax=Poseidonibacter lekithochrous TaxID=1904463 RepID=UPI0008FCD3DC|nr:DUF4011 domain-containing protein [Poseidonibacter lekithochrous]QKJ22307.1 DNA2 domain-containing protein (DUF4011 domain) [Poseidonibacter lekithochrous]